MPEFESLVLTNPNDEEKATLLATMYKVLHFTIIVHHLDDPVPRSLAGLSLKHNSPKETREILDMHKVPRQQIDLFIRVY